MSEDILSRLQSAKNEEEREWVILEFSLENLEKEIRDAVWASAIPHWYDEKFLAALLDKQVKEVKEIYNRLKELSFIEVFPERGYNVHERTRKLLLEHLWKESNEWYRELSERAVKYCDNQDQNDILWRVESIYHVLIAEPEDGADRLLNTGWEWNNAFAYNKVEAMTRAAREHAAAGRLSNGGLAQTQFWEALLDLDYFRYLSAKERFLQIRISDNTDLYLVAEVKYRLGNVHSALSEYKEARARYEEALPICREIGYRQGEVNCTYDLGNVHRSLGEHEEARARYEEALPIYQEIGDRLGEANSIYGLGEVHRSLGEHEEARAHYEEALLIYQEIRYRLGEANCIYRFGNVYESLSEYEEARARYEEALPICREIGDRLGEANCIFSLGEVYLSLGKYEEARARYEEVLPIYRQIGDQRGEANTNWGLGDNAKYIGAIASARKYYQNALEIFTSLGAPDKDRVQAALDALSDSSDNESARSKSSNSLNKTSKKSTKPKKSN